MLMECLAYNDERILFIESLQQFSNITLVNTQEMFHVIMSYQNGDTEFAKAVCLFVTSTFSKRELIITNKY